MSADRKILQFPSKFEPDEDPHTKALNDALNAKESETSAMHPLEIYLDREFLITELEASCESIRNRYDWATASETERGYVEAVLQQRVDFLEELRGMTDEKVYVALYPVDGNEPLGMAEEDMYEEDLPGDEKYGDLGNPRDGDLPL